MRELFVATDLSTETSVVLRTSEGDEFFLDMAALDDAARQLLARAVGAPTAPAHDSGTGPDTESGTASGTAELDDAAVAAPISAAPRQTGRVVYAPAGNPAPHPRRCHRRRAGGRNGCV